MQSVPGYPNLPHHSFRIKPQPAFLAGSAPGGTWGISFRRLLAADDSLSLPDVRILTLSVLSFSSIFQTGKPALFLHTIVYALHFILSIIFHAEIHRILRAKNYLSSPLTSVASLLQPVHPLHPASESATATLLS